MSELIEGLIGQAVYIIDEYNKEMVEPTPHMVKMLWLDFDSPIAPEFDDSKIKSVEAWNDLHSKHLWLLKDLQIEEKEASLTFIAENEELLRRQYPFEIAKFVYEWYEEVGSTRMAYPKQRIPDVYYMVFFTVVSPFPEGIPVASSFQSILDRWLNKLVVEIRHDIKRRLREDAKYRQDIIEGKQFVPADQWGVLTPAQSIEYANKWEEQYAKS